MEDSFELEPNFPELSYSIDLQNAWLIWQGEYPKDSIKVSYRVFPFAHSKTYFLKDTSLIRKTTGNSDFDPGFAYTIGELPEGYNSSDGINKSGYLSRGINVGNAQDLSVNSDLNLQLTGKLTDDLLLRGSISDANIPIQPGGNSATLQDFDQVYINVYNDQFSLTGGDYQLRSKPSRYLNYFKRTQGANVQYSFLQNQKTSHQIMASAAVSKGKYSRNIFTATEGNQGPYRLTGAEGEQFVVVLAGTERVYIDGKLMQRGEEYDYVIDYNAAELTFTPNQLITKDKRIQVEFQYSDRNYARSIFQVSDHITSGKVKAYISAYSEQDAKNQTLQQDLTEQNIVTLTRAGDNLLDAFIPAIDSTGYTPEGVHYQLVDSLGFDSVFVFSTNPDLGNYTLGFSQVGQGNGDYVQNGFSANGRIFKWVSPEIVNGELVRQGQFAPFIVLVSPKKQQVLAGGIEAQLSQKWTVKFEGSVTNNDLNTFSSLDAQDDVGYSSTVGLNFKQDSLIFNSWNLEAGVSGEIISNHFRTTERFRTVEFLRDWNLLDLNLNANQVQTVAALTFSQSKYGRIGFNNEVLQIGEQYSGSKSSMVSDIKTKKIKWSSTASFLQSDGIFQTEFYRHKNNFSLGFKPFRLGYEDELETNTRVDSLTSGYEFFDYQFYAKNPDSSRNKSKIFYRQRTDKVNVDGLLSTSAVATQIGASYEWLTSRAQSAKINISRRELEIVNDSLIDQQPENTILGRLEYRARALKNTITTNLFYQVGSGLEQRREYIYLEVPAGQGVYVWNDYNQDGVRDLSEFEIAAFSYEANFIRSFVPSNVYERVFSNGFNLNVNVDFSQQWSGKSGIKRVLSKLNNQFLVSADRKTLDDDNAARYNPFNNNINEAALQALNSSIRNTIFFNKLSPKWGADYTAQQNANKVLLSNGLESRSLNTQQFNLRWNYSKQWVLKLLFSEELSGSEASFNTGRNFNVRTRKIRPELTWQPNPNARIKLSGSSSNKLNQTESAQEGAELIDVGLESRYGSPGKGSLEANVNLINVDFEGDANTPLAFEMLEGLRPGANLTWAIQLQQNISKTVQVTVGYFGRKSEENPFIHSGTMQVRALF